MPAIDSLRRVVREERYRISSHANEEMSKDELLAEDIEQMVMSGRVTRKFTRDVRGTRYEVTGRTIDGRTGCVVCRFVTQDMLLIVTAFAQEE